MLNYYRSGGPKNCPFPTFPEHGGILPAARDTSGGDLFWLTLGAPEQWTVVLFDWGGGWEYEQHAMGLVKFLAERISGRAPKAFFGIANSPILIRRDTVFCPVGQQHRRP
jgi:hypothetical protein